MRATATVTVTEKHLNSGEAVSGKDPVSLALLDALPGVEAAEVGRCRRFAVARLTLWERPRWHLSRTVRVSLGWDAWDVAALAYFAEDFQPSSLPVTFTVRVPRAAVTP